MSAVAQSWSDDRLLAVIPLLNESNRRLGHLFESGNARNNTGFIAYNPAGLYRLIIKLLRIVGSARPISLDLGCGNGGWALMAAAAGFTSFGIDINPLLVGHARRNCRLARARSLIDEQTQCEFVVGNMYPADYATCARNGSAQGERVSGTGADAYHQLGINIADAGVIYAYAWPKEMPFLCEFLAQRTRPDAILVLPVYATGDYNRHLRLKPLDPNERHFCIGTRV